MMFQKFINRRFSKWLKRRMPANQEITLNSGNIFILPSKAGVQFLISCFILFLLGTNYQNNLILFLVYFLLSFMVTNLLLSYHNLANLNIKATELDDYFVDQDCAFKLRLSHSTLKAKDLQIYFQNRSASLQSVIHDDQALLYARSSQRGLFDPGRVTVKSHFPFGLFVVWTHIDFALNVLLYPKPIENSMQMTSVAAQSHDESVKQSVQGIDQFSHLKNYQVGESLKAVAWKQLAQGRGWLSKQFEQSVSGKQVLDINSISHLPLETRLSYLCYQVLELDKQHQEYALILSNSTITSDRGLSHKKQCLRALALEKSA